MTFATTIGHTFAGVLGHHGHVAVPRQRTAVRPVDGDAAQEDRRTRSAPAGTAVDRGRAVRAHDEELERWRAAFTVAIGLNR